jgi:bifunctional DNA-binding transcriptional regulator/antitoxin component of YhaV-PrlF toxin-antitoxin module
MKNDRGYVSTVWKEDDEFYITLPEEVIAKLGWNPMDTLEFSVNEKNEIMITKILTYKKETLTNDG